MLVPTSKEWAVCQEDSKHLRALEALCWGVVGGMGLACGETDAEPWVEILVAVPTIGA